MRAYLYSLMMITPFIVPVTALGQEQKTLPVIPEKQDETDSEKNAVAEKPESRSRKAMPRKADQRMTMSQRLIHQRALEQARQRLYRINARKAMGISLSRPNVVPTNVEIIQPRPTFYYNPHRFFYGYWYGP